MSEKYTDIQSRLDKQRNYIRSKKIWDVETRKKYLRQLKDTIEKYKEEIIEAVDKDLGKNKFKTVYVEVDKPLSEIDSCLQNLDRWSKPKRVRTPLLLFPASSYIYSEPYGHSLVIAPWNYPFNLAMIPMIGALAAGNSVCIKPSEISEHTSAIIAKIISEALPEEVAIVVEGAVEETTFLLDQKFDHIFYTGNGFVGRIIMEKAAKHLTPVVLELGGKSPVVVNTSNLDLAAKRIVFGKFFNCGQTCIAPDYILLPAKDKKAFVEYAKKWIEHFYQDVKNSEDYGRIVSEKHFSRLEGLLEGSEVLLETGRDKESKYFGPTILSSTSDSKVMQEEIFHLLKIWISIFGKQN